MVKSGGIGSEAGISGYLLFFVDDLYFLYLVDLIEMTIDSLNNILISLYLMQTLGNLNFRCLNLARFIGDMRFFFHRLCFIDMNLIFLLMSGWLR